MKAIICEVCGSTQFLKQDDLYICEGCGMKYTVPEISKLVQEMPDDFFANNSSAAKKESEKNAALELELLYQSARAARDSGDLQKAAGEYDQIFKKDPSSWEAAFYGSYLRAKQSTVYQVRSASYAIRNSVSTSLKLIRTHVQERQAQVNAVQDVAVHATEISNFLYDMARTHYDSLDNDAKKKNRLTLANDCSAAKDILYGLGNDVDTLFSEYPELSAVIANAWKEGVDKHSSLVQLYDYTEANRESFMEYVPKIQKYEKNYTPPEVQKKKRGCYVATAVYGSYDCPEVWTLRRYRDRVLAASWHGRAFIRCYYAVSPTLVRWFGSAAWFRDLWKPWLDRLVRRLNTAGLSDRPYADDPEG